MLLQEERGKSAISTENSTILSLYAKKHKNDRSTSKQPNKYTNDTTTTIFKTNRTYAQFFVVVVVQVRMK